MHHQPSSDWVAYVVMFFVVGGVILGKFLMFKGDKEENIEDKNK